MPIPNRRTVSYGVETANVAPLHVFLDNQARRDCIVGAVQPRSSTGAIGTALRGACERPEIQPKVTLDRRGHCLQKKRRSFQIEPPRTSGGWWCCQRLRQPSSDSSLLRGGKSAAGGILGTAARAQSAGPRWNADATGHRKHPLSVRPGGLLPIAKPHPYIFLRDRLIGASTRMRSSRRSSNIPLALSCSIKMDDRLVAARRSHRSARVERHHGICERVATAIGTESSGTTFVFAHGSESSIGLGLDRCQIRPPSR